MASWKFADDTHDKLRQVRSRDVVELLLLSVLWGAAYLFMRAAVPSFGPAPLIATRLALAVLALLPLLLLRRGWPALRAHPREMLVLGLPYTALPFMLLGYASLHITAGLIAGKLEEEGLLVTGAAAGEAYVT